MAQLRYDIDQVMTVMMEGLEWTECVYFIYVCLSNLREIGRASLVAEAICLKTQQFHSRGAFWQGFGCRYWVHSFRSKDGMAAG